MAGVGNLITATDYNSIQTVISQVLGTGSGDFGYGQTPASSAVTQLTVISASNWVNLRTDILNSRLHQTGTDYSSSLAVPAVGEVVSDLFRSDMLSMANLASASRLTAPPESQIARINVVPSKVRTDKWNGTLTQIITVTFASDNAARHFFNTGSSFEFTASNVPPTPPNASNAKSVSWANLLLNMGTISFNHSSTVSSNYGLPGFSGINQSAIGWYNLTSSNQEVFSKNSESGTYGQNDYHIFARKTAGNVLVFTITFQDDSGQPNPPYGTDEDVYGTLTSTVQVRRSSGAIPVATPAATTTDL